MILKFCRYQGVMCEYADENGFCKLIACAYIGVVYSDSTITKKRILKENEAEQ